MPAASLQMLQKCSFCEIRAIYLEQRSQAIVVRSKNFLQIMSHLGHTFPTKGNRTE
jgi:hypothetical protein